MKSSRVLLLLAALLTLSLAASAQAPVQNVKLFLKLDKIDGDAGVAGHEMDIPALSVSFGAMQQGLTMAGGAGSAAKAQISTITIQKLVDKTSPLLFIDCALGAHIATAKITFRTTMGSGPVDNLHLTLGNVLISSYNVAATDGDNGITESIGLSFTTMMLSFTPVDANGTVGTPITRTFNVTTNKQVADPVPQ